MWSASDREKIALVIPSRKFISINLLFSLIFSAAISTPALGASSDVDEKAGAVLFRDKGCAYCHGVGGTGGKKAPSLVDIRKNTMWTPAKMVEQITNGGQKMPPFGDSLTDQEIAQLVAYLRAKKRPVPPPLAATAPAQAPQPEQ
jgi:mono/diheme cytochrome c family protein